MERRLCHLARTLTAQQPAASSGAPATRRLLSTGPVAAVSERGLRAPVRACLRCCSIVRPRKPSAASSSSLIVLVVPGDCSLAAVPCLICPPSHPVAPGILLLRVPARACVCRPSLLRFRLTSFRQLDGLAAAAAQKDARARTCSRIQPLNLPSFCRGCCRRTWRMPVPSRAMTRRPSRMVRAQRMPLPPPAFSRNVDGIVTPAERTVPCPSGFFLSRCSHALRLLGVLVCERCALHQAASTCRWPRTRCWSTSSGRN